MPEIPYLSDTRCCGKCKTIPPICGLQFRCPCHAESIARARMAVRRATVRHSIQDHWPEEAL